MLFKKKESPSEMLPAVQVVSGGVYFGIIKTTSPIRIEGDFKGIIFCTNKVIIDKKATVNGDILCHEIVVGGLIDGNVICKNKCTLSDGAVVNGIVRTAKFENGDDSSVIGPVYVSKENTNIDVDEYYELFNKKETLEKIKAEYFSLPPKIDIDHIGEIKLNFNMGWLNSSVKGYFRRSRHTATGILLLAASFLYFPTRIAAQCPPNIGFEKGSFLNWVCSTGKIDSTGVITLNETEPIPGNHTLIPNTLPQQKDRFGNFPITCPNGSGYSIRLGNEQTGAGADAISYTLTVPADKDSYSILYNYAVVFQNPDHAEYQQPRFTAKVFDIDANDYIFCSSFDFVASGNLPGFKLAGSFGSGAPGAAASVYYKPWSPVTITLEGYAGKRLKIEFTVNDCTRGGHFGYAYLDVNEQCAGLIGGNVICAGYNSTTLLAPYGFQSYHWFNQDFTKSLGNDNTLTLKPAPKANSVIALEVLPYPGSGCIDTLYTTMQYSSVPFKFTTVDTSTTCAPLTIDLTAARITAGSSSGLSFEYYMDSTLKEYIPSAQSLDETGRYYIKASNAEGCIDIRSVSVTIDKVPDITVTDPKPVYYPNKVDITSPLLIKGDADSLHYSYWKDLKTTVPLQFAEAVGITGLYYIRATSFYGCTDVYPVKVNILIPYPPNAFSPNGDGVHDTWQFPALSVYPLCRVDIFDRYGRLLFHSIGYDKPWDGKYEGKPLPVGTYYYVIKPSEKLDPMSGSITLLY